MNRFWQRAPKSIDISYSEEEVRKLFADLQYETAQHIIGNRENPIIPLDYFEEYKK